MMTCAAVGRVMFLCSRRGGLLEREPTVTDSKRQASCAGGDLPHALTFFLTSAQRTEVLRVLKRRDKNRSAALLRALRIGTTKGGAR
jgi:hypothetical protein